MFRGISGKKVLVTGASGGIGSQIAALFSAGGAVVGVHYYRNRESAVGLVKQIEQDGGTASLFQADLADQPAHNTLIPDFLSRFGHIDVLVNNAGANLGNIHFLDLEPSSWERTFNLNCAAPFFLARQAFQQMASHGGGRIINITSVSAKYGGSVQSMHYAAAKGALETITLGLAKAGAPHSVLVNAVQAGFVQSAFHDKAPKPDLEERIRMIPLQRAGTPLDIARLVLYLSSEGGDYITGQVFPVTGGD